MPGYPSRRRGAVGRGPGSHPTPPPPPPSPSVGAAAADQARRETAFEGAVWFLDRVVAVHDHAGTDQALACELRLELAEAHDRAGEFTARDRRHLEAAELAGTIDRTDLFTRRASATADGSGSGSAQSHGAGPARRGAGAACPSDSRARALALARLSHVLTLAAPHAERQAESDEAVAMARRLDAPVVLASVLVSRSLALDGPDDVDEQLELGAEVMAIGRQTGDPDLVLQGARPRVQALFVIGRHTEAQILARELTALAHEVRHPDHLRIASMWATMWAVIEGRFDEAQARADALRDELRAAGHSQAQLVNVAQTFVLRFLHGGLEVLRPVIEAGRQSGAYRLNIWSLRAWLEAGSGNLDRARDLLEEEAPDQLATQDRGYLWLPTVIGAAAVASLTGHRGWASAAHEALHPYAGRNVVMGYASFLGAVDHHLGTLDAALGRTDTAADELEAGLERHRASAPGRSWRSPPAGWPTCCPSGMRRATSTAPCSCMRRAWQSRRNWDWRRSRPRILSWAGTESVHSRLVGRRLCRRGSAVVAIEVAADDREDVDVGVAADQRVEMRIAR